MKKCQKCSVENVDAAHYCATCGEPLFTTQYEVISVWRKHDLEDLEDKYVRNPTIKTGFNVLIKAIKNSDAYIMWMGCMSYLAIIGGLLFVVLYSNRNLASKYHLVPESGKYALFKKEKQLTPYVYDTLFLNSDQYDQLEYVLAISNGKYGRLDSKGQILDSCKYDYFSYFKSGWAVTKADGYYGYVKEKKRGAIREVQPQFLSAADFREGFARIQYQDGTNGWLDKDGNEVPWGRVYMGGHYSNGLAWLSMDKQGNEFGYVDTKGRIRNLHVVYCYQFNKRRAFVSKGAGYAMIDTRFNYLTDYEVYPWRDPSTNQESFTYKFLKGWKCISDGVECYVNRWGKITRTMPIK